MWVDAAPDKARAKSGLELVFSGPDGREIRRSIGPALLRALSRDDLELDEALLREALAAALEQEDGGASRRNTRGGRHGG